jgi:tetratricopeptide (TPR) repeat protein
MIPLCAQNLGVIRFVLGDVQYRSNQNSPWKTAALNQAIEPGSILKTGLDSSVEILWSTNMSSNIGAGKSIVSKDLYDEVHKKQQWVKQLKDKASNLSLQSKQKATTVAGIRRDEVEIKSQSDLYWDMDPLQSLDEAIALFETKEFDSAIRAFDKVIDQGPLKKDAELAHTYLILIYEEQKNVNAMKKQIGVLRTDFPRSVMLDSLPKDL